MAGIRPLISAGFGVSAEAWLLAREGRHADAARLLARALSVHAALSRMRGGNAIFLLGSNDRWAALLRSLRSGLDPASRREIAERLERASRSLRSARDDAAASLLATADTARTSDEVRSAPGWEAAMLTLGALTDAPDAGLHAHDVLTRWRAVSDRMRARDARGEPLRPADRPLLVVQGELTFVRGEAGKIERYSGAVPELCELAASW